MQAAVIVTYRCNSKCVMCNIWKHPTTVTEEITPKVLSKLPVLSFCNITGGEPFIRDDIEDIVAVLRGKARRVVISTNGYYTDRILELAKRHPDIGFRISIEGLPASNDKLRGLKDGFDHGLRTLLELRRLGVDDIGFGTTVSDENAADMLQLYRLARAGHFEFATAVVHNSFYFHKYTNTLTNREQIIACLRELVNELLRTNSIKNWFRAYFNYGLIRYVKSLPRLLPCKAGTENFFVDPWGVVWPCNGLEESIWMDNFGNLNDSSFDDMWHSDRAKLIREKVRTCSKNCWMIGTAAPVMRKSLKAPLLWVLKNKLSSLISGKLDVGEG